MQMDLSTSETFSKTISKVTGITCGPMASSTQASGKTTRCTERVISYGQMANSTRDSLSMINVTVGENSHGKTAAFTKDLGSTVSKMAKAPMLAETGLLVRVTGVAANGLNG